MKVEINENKYALDIQLTPETVEEVSMLARFAMNAKAQKPSIYMSFYSKPYFIVHMSKRTERSKEYIH